MEEQKTPLYLEIIKKYGKITKFADAIGWSDRKTNSIANGKQSMKTNEVEKVAEYLHVKDAEEFMRIFYPGVSIKWTPEEKLA